MKAIRSVGIMMLLAVAAAGAAGDAGSSIGDFKTTAARNAADSYSAAMTRLSREFKEKGDAARKTCINQLNGALQAATKAGNLDEAIKIRDAVTKLSAENAEAAPGVKSGGLLAERDRLSQAMTSALWQSGDAKLKFNPDGTGQYAGASNAPWQWTPINGREAYIRFNNGWTVKLQFDESLRSFEYLECGNGTAKGAQSGKRLQS